LADADVLGRVAIEALPAAVYMTDAVGRITFYNEAAAALWGCRPELGDSKFWGSWKLYWPDGTPLPYDECPMAMALRQKRPIRGMEAIAERPDGTRIPFIPYPTPLFDATGRLTGAINMLVDISDRKRAEADLAGRQAQLALAEQSALVGSHSDDPSLGRMTISDGYAAIHGLPEGTTETTRGEWRARVHPEDLARVEENRARNFRDNRDVYNLDYRIVRASGEVRWIEARGIVSYDTDGQPRRVIGINIDVSERKRAELALAERNIQLELAGRAALVGSYAYDVNKGTMQVSEGYAAIHGLPEGTTGTSYSEWRARVHPEDLERAEGTRDQAFADRSKEDNAEYRIVLLTGDVRWIERRGSISYSKDGRPERVVGVNIDVTERKRAEERQRALVAELDHRVKNALATVSSIVSHTGAGYQSVADVVAALEGRLRSMSATHELLGARYWWGVSLRELVLRELAPYAARNNTEVSGAEVVLRPEASQAMAMVLHELATNAAKYGALSSKEGRVTIRWDQQLKEHGHPPSLVLEWRESGGPRVVAPKVPGYGTSTIRDLVPYEFGGTVDLGFSPEGVRCRLELPANWLTHSNEGPASNVSHPSPATGNP